MPKAQILSSDQLGNLFFGQLHPYHQDFFDGLIGQHTRVPLRLLPHYIFWRDSEEAKLEESLYYRYLKESWRYYLPDDNTHEKRIYKVRNYIALYSEIQRDGIREPITVATAPDGESVIVDGNHRCSIAYHLGIDVPCQRISLQRVLARIIENNNEFYGTAKRGLPYQSIFYGKQELVRGRRRDVLERFQKMDIVNDIRGKTVADLGSNISMSAMLAWSFGARAVTAYEQSKKIAASALRLSTLLNSRIYCVLHDLGVPISSNPCFDTVFCFSLYSHVRDKTALEHNIAKMTRGVLYFEGHEGSSKTDYLHIFNHFGKVEELGFNRDGIHTRRSTRPFFRCLK